MSQVNSIQLKNSIKIILTYIKNQSHAEKTSLLNLDGAIFFNKSNNLKNLEIFKDKLKYSR